jgi:GT2 family glycosyltransferase
MKVKNSLEIILITYQRHSYLQNVFCDFFAPQSPLKDLDFTILDNASTDGTSELYKEYAAKLPNVNYIRYNKNIGGNANIARAFELAKKNTHGLSATTINTILTAGRRQKKPF